MKISYFAHSVDDAAVLRRIKFFEWASAKVKVYGFYRKSTPPKSLSHAQVVTLGKSQDGKFFDRIIKIAKAIFNSKALTKDISGSDLIVARNVEMLFLAYILSNSLKNRPKLIYECLDIHNKMFDNGIINIILRRIERFLISKSECIIVSSPAFDREYFRRIQNFHGRIEILENKVLSLPAYRETCQDLTLSQPWVIGWFGIIRCKKSLHMLGQLTNQLQNVCVLIAGMPAKEVFSNFEDEIAQFPKLKFIGAYSQDDLESLYSRVHFAWAIDYYEEGKNSAWLLPNRIYEGGVFGSVPIALEEVETGRWLTSRGIGVILKNPQDELVAFFSQLSSDSYSQMKHRVLSVPARDFAFVQDDAVAFLKSFTAEPMTTPITDQTP